MTTPETTTPATARRARLERILDALRNSPNGATTPELVASLGLPRGRIWQDIRDLRRSGHDIVKGAPGRSGRRFRLVREHRAT